jgi:hypothetical protein
MTAYRPQGKACYRLGQWHRLPHHPGPSPGLREYRPMNRREFLSTSTGAVALATLPIPARTTFTPEWPRRWTAPALQ